MKIAQGRNQIYPERRGNVDWSAELDKWRSAPTKFSRFTRGRQDFGGFDWIFVGSGDDQKNRGKNDGGG